MQDTPVLQPNFLDGIVDINTNLAHLFIVLWEHFLDREGIEPEDLESLLVESGLTEWREASEDEITISEGELEEGEMVLALNEDGKKLWDLRNQNEP